MQQTSSYESAYVEAAEADSEATEAQLGELRENLAALTDAQTSGEAAIVEVSGGSHRRVMIPWFGLSLSVCFTYSYVNIFSFAKNLH